VIKNPSSDGGVARHSLVYVVGSAISVLGGMLMVPVYTRALSTADYGLLDTILRFVTMCMSVAFLGMRQAYQRLYFDMQTAVSARELTSTVVLANFAAAVLVLFPILALASLIGRDFGASQLTVPRSAALALWIAFEATYLLGLSHMQVRMRSRQFVIAQSARLSLLMSINIVLLSVFHLGITGALIGNLSVSVISGLFAATVLLRSAGLRVSVKFLKEITTFGLPYIPTVFFAYVIGNADRLALIHFGAVASLGILALAAKIGELALMVFSGPVDNVWSPYALSVFSDANGPKKIGALYTKFVAIYVLMALGASLAAPIGVFLLAQPEYAFAARLVPIIALGWVFNVLAILSDIGILISKKTWMKPLATGLVSMLAVALQFLLTPRFGVIGAAVATALTNMAFFLIIRTVSQRFYRMVTRPRDFLIIAVSASVALLVGENLISAYDSLWVSLAASILGVIGYGAVLLRTGVIEAADVWSIAARLGYSRDTSGETSRFPAGASEPANIRSISGPFLSSSEGTGAKLRLAVLIDENRVPRYGRAVIDDLMRADFVQVVGWLQLSGGRRRRVNQSSGGPVSALFYKYLESRYRAAPDPFEMEPLEGPLAAADPESIHVLAEEAGDAERDKLSSRLRELNVDVVVDLSSAALRGEFCSIPRYGFWRFHFGDSRKYPDGSECLLEIIDEAALTAVELCSIAADPAHDEVLYRAEFSTQPHPSRLMNRFGPVWSAQHFVIQQLWKLHEVGPAAVHKRMHPAGVPFGGKKRRLPSDASIALLLARRIARRLRKARSKTANGKVTWRLAVRKSAVPLFVDTNRDALMQFRWFPAERGHSWADPMLISQGSCNWLFFEQWQEGLTKGQIWCGLLGEDGSLSEVRSCLRQPYHLSYPQLLEEQGEHFLVPESEEAGGVDLYRARQFPDDWVLETRLIDFPCVDPTIFRWQDRWWMIASPQNVKGVAAISWLFSAPRLTGPWTLHPAGPVAMSVENARGAGPIYPYESRLIRPSQDCGKSYGRALVFSEILSIDAGGYAETVIARVDAGWRPGLAGVHTYSRVNDWEVIDGGYTADGEDSLLYTPERTGR
jgi:O-antigen/teichoic acid export membrane protein